MEDSQKWQVKEGALRLLTILADAAPAQVSGSLPVIVPLISERMVDARDQVRGHLSVWGGWGVLVCGVQDGLSNSPHMVGGVGAGVRGGWRVLVCGHGRG